MSGSRGQQETVVGPRLATASPRLTGAGLGCRALGEDVLLAAPAVGLLQQCYLCRSGQPDERSRNVIEELRLTKMTRKGWVSAKLPGLPPPTLQLEFNFAMLRNCYTVSRFLASGFLLVTPDS